MKGESIAPAQSRDRRQTDPEKSTLIYVTPFLVAREMKLASYFFLCAKKGSLGRSSWTTLTISFSFFFKSVLCWVLLCTYDVGGAEKGF